MSITSDAVLLASVVGACLDASSGVVATCVQPLLEQTAALIGTNRGSVLLCANGADSAIALEPASDTTLHSGPVHAISLSTQQLVATAGHDAVVCVVALHAFFTKQGLSRCRRILGHAVPVVAVHFLSDGATLLTLGADGRLLIANAITGATLAAVSCGFAAACLSCSVDETVAYVGGRCLAAVDLQCAMRRSNLQTSAEAWGTVGGPAKPPVVPGVRLFEWSTSTLPGPHSCHGEASGKTSTVAHTQQAPRGTILRSLRVDPLDNALTAVFARSSPSAKGAPIWQSCGEARWPASGNGVASETRWEPLAEGSGAASFRATENVAAHISRTRSSVAVRCTPKARGRASAKHEPAESRRGANAAAALWHGRWYASPFSFSADVEAMRTAWPRTDASATLRETRVSPSRETHVYPCVGPLTAGEEVALAQAQCDELQRACDALVFQIRRLRSHREKPPAA